MLNPAHRDEPLLFELEEASGGVDFPPLPVQAASRLGNRARRQPVNLPSISEPQIVRHFTRLSQMNYGIDTGFFPLGSCTMKHNPRLNEKMARLEGFALIHPLQPLSTVPGALALMEQLAHWLTVLTGLPAVALTPGAGAHGELCGILAIKAALEARGQGHRNKVLVPESAHGTNPATAAACGFQTVTIPAEASGRVSLAAVQPHLDDSVAAIMITNPNTCGLFEHELPAIAAAVHAAGGFVYGDGANFNAIVGRIRPADLGVDAMHINLHKTFSTPHGGGGPGSGPVVLAETLAPYAPLPLLLRQGERIVVHEKASGEALHSFGRLKSYFGQFGTFVRALAYMMSLGADGLRLASGDAVLNANYIRVALQDVFHVPYPGICMHEALLSDARFRSSGVTTTDIAKALIDWGFHPMTVYFPLVVSGAMLIEPTETESRETLDSFITAMRFLAEKAAAGDVEYFRSAPQYAPRKRLDETLAARKPVLSHGNQ